MSMPEQIPVAATRHLRNTAVTATACFPARALHPGPIGASQVHRVANAVGRSPNVVVIPSLTAPCPTFTVVASDPLTRWAPFLSPSAVTRMRRAAHAASTKSALIAQILEFRIMDDETGVLTYGSGALEAERRNLARQGRAALLVQLKAVSQSDTPARQCLRLARAMVFASEEAQVAAILAEIGEAARRDRARTLDAVRRVQGITGRRTDDFGPSDHYNVLVACRAEYASASRARQRGVQRPRPKQYWSLAGPFERYVRRRIVEHALDALAVVIHFDPTLVERVTRDRIAFAALLDAAYALAVDAGASIGEMLKPFDLAASRLGLVGNERRAACGARPSRVRDHSEEGAERRKEARADRFPIEERTHKMISRGMASVDDEAPVSSNRKLLIDRLRDSPRPRLR